MKSSLFILLLGALTLLAGCSPLRQVVTQLDLLTPKAEAVLTPHMGELGRLSGLAAHVLEADRLTHGRALATRRVTTQK